jgi:hypothetical protein
MNNSEKIIRIKDKTKQTLKETTLHGPPRIFSRGERRLFVRILWLLLFLASTAGAIYTISTQIIDYLNFEVVTQIKLIQESPTEFPTVTFYNLKSNNLSLASILASCRFNDNDCTASDFETNTDEFGNIYYQFNNGKNSNHEKINIYKTKRAGIINGLSLILFAGSFDHDSTEFASNSKLNETLDYNTIISNGFHVVVQNHSIDPEYSAGISYAGINLALQFETSLIVNRIFTYKEDEPYSQCKKDLNSTKSDIYQFMTESTSYIYRQKDCIEYCIGKYIIEKCNITSNLTKRDVLWNRYISAPLVYNCITTKYYEFIGNNLYELCLPECPLECDSIRYDVSVSASTFPNKQTSDGLIYIYNGLDFSRNNLTFEQYKSNLVAFNVYYEELVYTQISESAKMTSIDLVANIGGVLGLFLGTSVLTFTEWIELIVEIIFILFGRDYRQKNTDETTTTTTTMGLVNFIKFNKLIQLFDRLIEINPKDPNVYFKKGNFLISINEYEEARKYFEIGLKLEIENNNQLKI